jgi:hypothetical protein
MIDNLSLLLAHGLLALAVLQLLRRPDLDDESGADHRMGARRRKPRDKPGA